ncbi:hypothetical protein EDB83DRAFT_2530463 [Lactarius deliciosus]|nr:hypothetical protein EDB83DRAFT_2530463 [Lactarius deliciosus]
MSLISPYRHVFLRILSTNFSPRPPARRTHLTPLHFVSVLPAAHDVPPTAAPRLAIPDSSPGLTAGLPSAALSLFGALGGVLKELILVLVPDVVMRTCGRLLGALGNTGAGLEVLEVSPEGTSDEVSLQALYEQVSSLLPNAQALRTLHLRALL